MQQEREQLEPEEEERQEQKFGCCAAPRAAAPSRRRRAPAGPCSGARGGTCPGEIVLEHADGIRPAKVKIGVESFKFRNQP